MIFIIQFYTIDYLQGLLKLDIDMVIELAKVSFPHLLTWEEDVDASTLYVIFITEMTYQGKLMV